jgi:SNF2 family DNA or RNA helicase
MGLGKTVMTLKALEYLHSNYLSNKTLIIAPKRIILNVWPQEIEKFEDFKYLSFSSVTGAADQRKKALKKDADIYLISIDNVVWLIKNCVFDFDTVVLDESTKFKSHSAQRFKALAKMYPKIKRMVQLTGTASSEGTTKKNALIELWAQMYLLDHGEALTPYISHYRKKYYVPDHMGFGWELVDGAKEKILKAIKPYIIRLSAEQHSKLPKMITNVISIDLPKETLRQYKTLEKEYLLLLSEGKVAIEAPNAGVVQSKLSQLSNGAIYDENKNYHILHDVKLDVLESLMEENATLLVAYEFKSDWERIKKRFPHARNVKEKTAVEDWNAGKIQMLCLHPKSGGHGLNLQKGGRTIAWFSVPWSEDDHQQVNARLQRTGQERQVYIHYLVVPDSVETMMLQNKFDKAALQKEILNYFEE